MSVKKLLIADDSLTIQKVIRLALSHEGYEIQTVSDASEARKQLLLFRPQIVLIDISLPEKTVTDEKSIEVKAWDIKTWADEKPELQETQFILMASAFEQVDETTFENAGFSGRLSKPFDPAHLRKVLIEAFHQNKKPNESLFASPPPIVGELPPFDDFSVDTQPPSLPSLSSLPSVPDDIPTFEIQEKTAETDIRQLTESTLKMTSMSDFDWSVRESPLEAPQKTPEHQPPEVETFDLNPSLPPLPKMNFDAPSFEPFNPPPLERVEKKSAKVEKVSEKNPENLSATIQQQVQQQVEAAVSKLSREVISEIAERVIKEEIHRLLKEGP